VIFITVHSSFVNEKVVWAPTAGIIKWWENYIATQVVIKAFYDRV